MKIQALAMKTAHSIKTQFNNFSEALKMAWKMVKGLVQEVVKTVKEATKEQVSSFWDLYKNYQNKSNSDKKVRAGEELIDFAKDLGNVDFGKYNDVFKKWQNASVKTNSFNKKLWVVFN